MKVQDRYKMKAAFRSKYGAPDVLSIKEVTKPVAGENELLIRVHAATVNRTDCGILWAKPFIMRFFTGLFIPRLSTTGTDFAGIVEEVGKGVSKFKAGDKVWGFDDMGLSSHAEYLAISEDKPIQMIPPGFSYDQAAASAEAAHYAYNFVNKVTLKPGQRVLVNGATGGIGSAALQFLKYYDIYVTAVCSSENIATVKSLGADRVIDYTKEDFTRDTEKYDFVLDAVGKSTFFKCRKILKKDGIYISSELGPYGQNLFLPLITAISKRKRVIFPIPVNIKASLEFIVGLMEQGRFIPLIDRVYPLEEIRDAYDYVASGQKIGNVIIHMRNGAVERS